MADEPTLADLDHRLGTVENRLGTVESRLGTLERRVNSMDQRLQRVEGRIDAMHTSMTSMIAFQQAHSERLTCLDRRFDDLEKLIRDGMNGHGS
ncbi:MAG: hypothetical protein OXG40_11265 [Acidimicrobiaceae bacterium]|nr:hypothetical protein [Acidimicrobiaceae bacterium]MDE0515043.1 hypothetical protein [Acidimicrobiaceae bacterium]MYI36112.1 hypothetical protein [Acidimicrobiaceae bacterium]